MPVVGDSLEGRYRIEAVLGAGGMATVYRATDLRLDREVALKVLAPNLALDPAMARRFEREARAMAGATHPNVVAVFDVDPGDPEVGREPFYVMELCREGSLADRIAARGAITPAELVPAIVGIAAGLADLHRRGLVHRDIKPSNILFAGDVPKLADFGLVRIESGDESPSLTAAGTTIGTLPYLAPELLAGAAPTPASDVYALAATAFEGLTGRNLNLHGLSRDVSDLPASSGPRVSAVAPELGDTFDPAILAGLAVDPAQRPNPLEFAAALEDALAGRPAETIGGPAAEAAPPLPIPLPFDALAETQPSIPIEPAPLMAVPSALAPAAPPPSGLPEPAAQSQAARPSGPTARIRAVILVVVLAALVLGVAASSGLLGSRVGGSPGPSATLPARTASPAAPTATPRAVAPALQALDAVVASIEAARGGKDGLSGRDANDLLGAATAIRQALDRADFGSARTGADQLARKVDAVAGSLDAQHASGLRSSVAALQAAIPKA